jgi:hypothetical protein
MDPYHVPILHGSFSGTQFADVMNQMPRVSWDMTERGVKSLPLVRFEAGNWVARYSRRKPARHVAPVLARGTNIPMIEANQKRPSALYVRPSTPNRT